jgi:glycosyltransferase involved in cell wall biosynthesis
VSAAPQPHRVAILVSHPTQYYSPWFQALGRRRDLQLRVFYLWDFGVTRQRDPKFGTEFKWDIDLLSGYESEFVPNAAKRPGAEHFWGFNNPQIAARLGAWRPDCLVLFGYKWASHLRAALWARRHRVPILFRGDSNLLGRPYPRWRVRVALRVLFGQFHSFLYVGQANRDYFRAFGVPESKLIFAPHSVNSLRFSPSDTAARLEASRLRAALNVTPQARVILFAGKFVPAKQPYELLQAFLELSLPDTVLVFVGDGPLRPRLEALAASAGEAAPVRFLPFANQTEMPARYLLADIFTLPSLSESWGLAINEAMHMGIPCLVSDRLGCQQDLVTPGETGWVFRAEDPAGLKRALEGAVRDLAKPGRKAELQAAVGLRISRYTYAQTTAGLSEALAGLAAAGPQGEGGADPI